MPPGRRVAGVLANRSVPLRTRRALLSAEARRRIARRAVYRVPYPSADLFLTHDDFEIDWETLKSVLADGLYATDYRDAVVLDIGAHKGYFGAYALFHGARHVVSFEPESVNAGFVRTSVASSTRAFGTWETEAAAVGSVGGEAELHVMEGSWGHALEPPDEWKRYETGVQRVPVMALSDVLSRVLSDGNVGSRVVVKMNIEGAECDVVLGTPAETWAEVDEVIVATHPWAACADTEIESHLGAAGLTRSSSAHPRMLRLRRAARSRSDRRIDPT